MKAPSLRSVVSLSWKPGALAIASACKSRHEQTFRFVTLLRKNRPIVTYGKRGTVRRPDAAHHAIAYMTDDPPEAMADENLDKHAIKIDSRNGATLHPASRVNFSMLYTIEHNVKVKSIGMVSDAYMGWVRYYWQEAMGLGSAEQTKVEGSHTDV